MRLAKYRSLDAVGIEIVLSINSANAEFPGYQRMSEVVDVEFPPLGGDDVSRQIEAIEAARKIVEKKYDSELARLDVRKAALQASLPEVA